MFRFPNVIGLAFHDMKPAVLYGKVSAYLNRTVEAVRKILKKYDLKKGEVIAPSLIPSKSGDKKKTDRCDARKLAEFLRFGHLTPVHIPDLDDEVIRDVFRGRTGAAQGLARTRKL
ncbi:hypothetical protein EGM51_16130 [Verrucomicrobia bacterium S94]|nr:hypothetical protein EGM51_16130 [Verrucomicrobia bacterium S94]